MKYINSFLNIIISISLLLIAGCSDNKEEENPLPGNGPTVSLEAPSNTNLIPSDTSTINFIITPSSAGGTTLTGSLTPTGEGITLTSTSGDPACDVTISELTTSGGIITLSNCSGNGTLTVHVNAEVAKDSNGNLSSASNESSPITVVSVVAVTPRKLSIDNGGDATFTATSVAGATYQWYSCTSITCTDAIAILGESNETFSAFTSTGTYYYQVILTDNNSDTFASNVVTLIVS